MSKDTAELLLEMAGWMESPWPPHNHQEIGAKLIERARKMAKEFMPVASDHYAMKSVAWYIRMLVEVPATRDDMTHGEDAERDLENGTMSLGTFEDWMEQTRESLQDDASDVHGFAGCHGYEDDWALTDEQRVAVTADRVEFGDPEP